ncbi:hypothetical protein CBL_10729 [Carabus blaptoides fortunei]
MTLLARCVFIYYPWYVCVVTLIIGTECHVSLVSVGHVDVRSSVVEATPCVRYDSVLCCYQPLPVIMFSDKHTERLDAHKRTTMTRCAPAPIAPHLQYLTVF